MKASNDLVSRFVLPIELSLDELEVSSLLESTHDYDLQVFIVVFFAHGVSV